MRATTGRAVSAAIQQRLRDALAGGEPLTYQALADQAGCTVRSVRNYLAHAEEIFGFPIERSRDDARRVLVRALDVPPSHNASRERDPFDAALSRALFPDRDETTSTHGGFTVAFRGLPPYGEHQHAAADRWAAACQSTSPTAHRLALETEPHTIALWPMRVVIHSLAGVVLVGARCDSQGAAAIASIDLADVRDDPDSLREVAGIEPPAFDPHALSLDEVLDLPFSAQVPDPREPVVHVHVRFDAIVAQHLAHRIWHRRQRVVLRRDGDLDVRFGPVPLGAAARWVASFAGAVQVRGDKKLRKAMKKMRFVP